LVPLQFDLVQAARPFIPTSAWERASWSDCVRAFESGLDYLFVEQPFGIGRMTTAQQLGSQVLRRAIAASIGNAESYNWREHPYLNNVDKTIASMSAAAQFEVVV
jgi:hypothetical protein